MSTAVEPCDTGAVVSVYDARTCLWEPGLVDELELGDEVLVEGHVLRVTSQGLEDRGFADAGQLAMADATWTVDGIERAPDGSDWVRVLGDGDDAGHWRLRDLAVGERFVFGGQVYETGVLGGEPAVRATGDVLGRVVDTFVRMAPEVIDAEVAYADGTSDVLTGTPNHPFWVSALRDYVPLGELEIGTVLHVQGGGEAILVSKTWRQGDFEQGSLYRVFDFEVEGLHNFYVRGSESDAAGVLVHNSTGGYATVTRHDLPTGPHVSIETVTPSGSSLHTEQLRLGGSGPRGGPTTVGVVDDMSDATSSIRIDLPNAEGAQAAQRSSVGADGGEYNVLTNSCVGHACDVLRAGGVDVPTGGREQIDFLNALGGGD